MGGPSGAGQESSGQHESFQRSSHPSEHHRGPVSGKMAQSGEEETECHNVYCHCAPRLMLWGNSGELLQEKTFVNWKIKILQKKLMQIATKP